MRASADVEIEISTPATAGIIKNLYPLYLHELSEYSGAAPNAHGVLEGPSSASLSEQAALLDVWWQAPGILFPFLIRVERLPAGFAFVASGKYVEQGIDASMQEFFLTHAYRRRGIAERAALKVLGGFPGRWEIRILESNLRARAFWTRVAQRIAPDHEQVEAEVSAGQRGRILRLSVAPALHAAPRA